jgi:hypothetical protein
MKSLSEQRAVCIQYAHVIPSQEKERHLERIQGDEERSGSETDDDE